MEKNTKKNTKIETKQQKERRYQQEMYDKWIITQLFICKDRFQKNEENLFIKKLRSW